MDFNKIIHPTNNKDLVDIIKYGLNIVLEAQCDAEDDEIVDEVMGRMNGDKSSVLRFGNSNGDKILFFCFKPYDFEMVEYSIGFDMKLKKHNVETVEDHLERRKKYVRIMAEKIDKIYGAVAKEKYATKANAIIEKCEEKNSLEK